jgi:NADPH:quinone reductase-like Zn-dependent oxidoreductase
MRAILHVAYGSPDALRLGDLDKPDIADDQVLVRVHASSVNPAEYYRVWGPVFARFGQGLLKPKTPKIGADLAGRIEAVGKDITDFKPGDEVFGTSGHSWAEWAPAREIRLARKPPNVSFEEAASVPVAALTALQALKDKGNVQPGQKVLINGASGGVGTFAVQIAKALGAEVTAVCSTRNVEQAAALGADVVCDYTQEDFTKSGVRHDLMVDIAGSKPFSNLRRVLKDDADVVLVGAKMKGSGLGPLPRIARLKLGSIGKSQSLRFFICKINKPDLDQMSEWMADGKVKPVVDRTYELSEVPQALRYLGEGHARGKIAITMA